MRARISAICLLFLLAAAGCAPDAGGPDAGKPDAGKPKPDCAINNGACLKVLDGAAIELDIRPKPVRSMRELDVIVKVTGASNPGSVILDLSMPGMYMGENRVLLSPAGGGLYTGKAVIPRCVYYSNGGSRLWRARVEYDSKKSADFYFNVAPHAS